MAVRDLLIDRGNDSQGMTGLFLTQYTTDLFLSKKNMEGRYLALTFLKNFISGSEDSPGSFSKIFMENLDDDCSPNKFMVGGRIVNNFLYNTKRPTPRYTPQSPKFGFAEYYTQQGQNQDLWPC